MNGDRRARTIVWTVGHSTLPIEAFVARLRACNLDTVADVRRYPSSRRYPQFGHDALAQTLASAGIAYLWLPNLGGRRAPRKDSRNTGWRENGFRGYADYMETEAFQAATEQLIQTATGSRTAIMCAEAAWQQCHRGLIADWLLVHNVDVVHILRDGTTAAHTWTAAVRVIDGHLSYAVEESIQRTLGLD